MTMNPGEIIKPPVEKDLAVRLIGDLYGLRAKDVKEFNSYDDRNFFFKSEDNENPHVTDLCEDGYLLKVTNWKDSEQADFYDAQNEMISLLATAGMAMPEPIKNKNGALKSMEYMLPSPEDTIKKGYIVRVLRFIPGKILYDVSPWTAEHFFQSGKFVAKMDMELQSFSHHALESREFIWSMSEVPKVKDYLHVVKDESRRKLCASILKAFDDEVSPVIGTLARGPIHGDFNEQNILMRETEPGSGQYRVHTAIDFGDSHVNPLVFELAITIMYTMTKSTVVHPNMVGAHVVAGYTLERALPDLEWRLLRTLVASRYVQSLVLGAYSHSFDPKNDYVLTTAKTGWKVLAEFWDTPSAELYENWEKITKSYSKPD